MSSRDSYYESDEWQEWSDRIHVVAERCGVELVEGTPAQTRADGLWLGESEPSGAYTVAGDPERIERWAADVAGYYNQDAVMVLHGAPDGPDELYTFDTGEATSGEDLARVHAAMKAAGIPGGRLVDGRLEVVSTPGQDDALNPATVRLLQQRLGIGADHTTVMRCRAVFVEKSSDRLTHSPIKEIQAIRQLHAERHGLPVRGRAPHLTAVDDIAASMAYEAGKHQPKHPKIQRSYRALSQHITEQYDELTAAGYTFEPWRGEREQPYADSAEMLADLRDHRHLFYFRTEASQDSEGALPGDHPMARMVNIRGIDGTVEKQCLNDVFRVVHDAIAHSEGHQFGPHGEKMAWWAHRSSLPREAHLALWNETRAQNVFTNAGPHMRTSDDEGGVRLHRRAEPNWLGVTERPYAEQKCVVVPAALT